MKNWQKYWLYGVIIFSLLHLVRDIMQDLGVKNLLTTFLASPGPPKVVTTVYWTVFNTYLIEITAFVLSIICLKRNYFGYPGKLTMIIAVASLFLWLIYWLVL